MSHIRRLLIARSTNLPFVLAVILAATIAVTVGLTQILPALAAGVVGDGTPASCTEASLRAAVAGGGLVTFDCGQSTAAPVTIHLTQRIELSTDVVIDGGAKGGHDPRRRRRRRGRTQRRGLLRRRRGHHRRAAQRDAHQRGRHRHRQPRHAHAPPGRGHLCPRRPVRRHRERWHPLPAGEDDHHQQHG